MKEHKIVLLNLFVWLLCVLPWGGQAVCVAKSYPRSTAAVIKERLDCLDTRIPLHYNRHVQSFITYFTERHREYTERILARKSLYFPLLEYYLAKHKLPDELKYLVVVESGLRPDAVSKAGAVGLWQFMPSTGRLYGLASAFCTDDRRDPHKATEAACLHLKDLYSYFGDWELVLAAFNSGTGRVSRAIRRSGARSFWRLHRYLPRETRSYVPQFIAITYVMNYHHYYNIFPKDSYFMPQVDTVHITMGCELQQLATTLTLCKDELVVLNPMYFLGLVPSGRRCVVRLPVQAKDVLNTQRKDILSQLSVAAKPALTKAKKKFNTRINNKKRIRYRVRRGDALSTIARRYRVRVSDVKRWNKLRSSRIYAGQRLTIWTRKRKSYGARTAKRTAKRATTATKPPGKHTYYIVKKGDTLWNIAKARSTSIAKIKRINRLRSTRIRHGQKLLLPTK